MNRTFFQDGYEHGLVLGAQNVFLRFGRKKFGEPPADILVRIQTMEDPDRLIDLAVRALDVSSWDELFATDEVLAEPQPCLIA